MVQTAHKEKQKRAMMAGPAGWAENKKMEGEPRAKIDKTNNKKKKVKRKSERTPAAWFLFYSLVVP